MVITIVCTECARGIGLYNVTHRSLSSSPPNTFFHQHSIKKEDLKSTSENTESLPLLLLDENSKSCITISFGLIDIGDAAKPPKIKMTVRERLDSGIVKVVWSDFLESGSAAGNNGINAYLFSSFLTTSLRDANKDIAELRADLSKAKADMTGWKDTASKLDSKWQKEKDGLTERFLVLYNRVKSDLRDAKKELSDEKKKKTVRVEPLVQNALAPEEPSAAKNYNDQEELMWDADMVEMMAAGPAKKKPSAAAMSNGASRKVASTTSTATKPSAKRTRHDEATKAKKSARHNGDESPSKKLSSRAVQDSSDDDEDDLGASQSQARANPYSGATEMWGPGGIFAESQGGIDDFETYRKKRDAMKKTKAKSSSTAASTDEKAREKQTIDLAGDDSDDSF